MNRRLRLNLLANFVGRAWTALSVYIFVPFYIQLLGVEQYGVVAFYSVLMGLFAFANFGLSGALSRELARLSVLPGSQEKMSTTARTLEVVFRGIGLTIAAVVVSAAPWIANDWVQTDTVDPAQVTKAIQLMGIALALRFPTELCLGGLSGLQHQVLSNGLRAGFGTVRGLGALAVLVYVESTVETFFAWQVLVNVAEAIASNRALWRSLPSVQNSVHFQVDVFRGLWKYAAGLTGLSLLSVAFTQLDKLVVSRTLGLEEFAQYSVAALASRLPLLVGGPVDEAFGPHLTQQVSLKDPGTADTYHRACQLISVVVIPPSLLFAFRSETILALWTQNEEVASYAATPAALLVIGSMCMAFQLAPFRLALAHGWTTLSIKINSVALVFFVPAVFVLTGQFQVNGAASSWLLLNALTTLPLIILLHRRVLSSRATVIWFREDVGIPLVAGISSATLTLLFVPEQEASQLMLMGELALSGALIFLCVALATPTTRTWIGARSRAYIKKYQ